MKARDDEMAALFRDGMTLHQIGDRCGLSRARVQQILSRRFGIKSQDGGAVIALQKKTADAQAARDAKHLSLHGCLHAQLRSIPSRARLLYRQQRVHARARGIAWQINLWQWWTIWQASGHWENRGRRGDQYVMCRYGDLGPYAIGNVFIATARENITELNDRRREQVATDHIGAA